MIEQFYEEKERISKKEQALQEAINQRMALIESNESKYKTLLKEGKEKEADDLFKTQYELKAKQASDSTKLQELRPIHQELLREKALEVLDTDLIKWRDTYAPMYLELLKEQQQIEEAKKANDDAFCKLEQKIKGTFNAYDFLAESQGLRESHSARFNCDPYRMINYPLGKIESIAKKNLKRGK